MFNVHGANAANTTYVAQNGKTYTHSAEDVLAGTVQDVLHPTKVAELLAEYVQEAAHGGWEGFNARDLTGVRKLLNDIALYMQEASKCDEHVIAYRMHERG
jgi:hypothetical protein